MSINIHNVKSGLSVLVTTAVLSACGGNQSPPATQASQMSTTQDATSSPTKATIASVTALKVTGTPPTSIAVGGAYYFNANTSGGSGSTVGFSIQNKPSWATLNTVTGELRGTPNITGTFGNIIISASDGQSTAKLPAFSINVYGVSKASVTVSWAAPSSNTDGSTFDNPAGFVIHYGTSASNLNQSVSIGSSAARSYNLTGLSKGSTYYFCVAAINTLKVEGQRSAVSSIAL